MTEGWFATQLFGFIAGAATAGRAAAARRGADGERARHRLQPDERQPPDGGRRRHPHALDAGRASPARAPSWRPARAARHHRLQGDHRRPLRPFQELRPRHEPDWDALAGGLGTRFPLLETHGFKVWPACAYTRPTNAAMLHLRKQHALRPEDVESITIVGGTGGTQLLSSRWSRSAARSQHRRQVQHSVHDGGDDGVRQRHAARLHGRGAARPGVLAMADRVSYRAGPQPVTGKGGSGDVSQDFGGDRDARRQNALAPAGQRSAGRPEKPSELGRAGSENSGTTSRSRRSR